MIGASPPDLATEINSARSNRLSGSKRPGGGRARGVCARRGGCGERNSAVRRPRAQRFGTPNTVVCGGGLAGAAAVGRRCGGGGSAVRPHIALRFRRPNTAVRGRRAHDPKGRGGAGRAHDPKGWGDQRCVALVPPVNCAPCRPPAGCLPGGTTLAGSGGPFSRANPRAGPPLALRPFTAATPRRAWKGRGRRRFLAQGPMLIFGTRPYSVGGSWWPPM